MLMAKRLQAQGTAPQALVGAPTEARGGTMLQAALAQQSKRTVHLSSSPRSEKRPRTSATTAADSANADSVDSVASEEGPKVTLRSGHEADLRAKALAMFAKTA